MSSFISYGLQSLLDSHQRFTNTANGDVYLRVKNFPEDADSGQPQDFVEVGVPLTVTGSEEVGVEDILIDPPPTVNEISAHNLGMLAAANVRLNFGSQIFRISNTWVQAQMQQLGITDPRQVFRNRDGNKAVGIYYEGRLFTIENIIAKTAGGDVLSWDVTGNATELTEADLGGS